MKSNPIALPVLVILGVSIVFWWPMVSGDASPYIRDLAFFANPMKHYMVERLTAGELPLWTPYVSAGMPFLADPANQVLYPPNFIFFLFPTIERALSLWVVLHSFFAMCTFAVLCRTLGVCRWIAVWSGITYGLAGYSLSITDNVNFLPAVTWVPAAIAFYQHGLTTRRHKYCVWTALCLSFIVLAGDPLNAVLLTGVFVLMTATAIRTPPRVQNIPFPVIHLFAAIGLALLVASAQILPTLELLSVSVRESGLEYEEIGLWSFPFARMLEFFQPYIFGSQFPTFDLLAPGLYPSKSVPWADSVYLGTITVALALGGAIFSTKSRIVWITITITALLMSFGANAPYHEVIVNYVPFIGTQRYPEKFIFWVTVSVCVLASLGAQNLLDRRVEILTVTRVSYTTKVISGIAIVLLLCWLCVYLPAKIWFWDFALRDLTLWTVRTSLPLNHFMLLTLHTVFMFSVVLIGFAVEPRHRGRYLVVLLLISALDLFWVHHRGVPLMPEQLRSALEESFAAQKLSIPSDNHLFRIYYDSHSPGENISYLNAGPLNQILTETIPNKKNLTKLGYPHLYAFLFRRDRLHPNIGANQGIQYLNGSSSPLRPAANAMFHNYLLNQSPSKFVTMANVRYVLTGIMPNNPAWDDDQFITIGKDFTRNLRILENQRWLPRVLVVPNAIGTDNETKVIYAALNKIEDPRNQVTVVSDLVATTDQPTTRVAITVNRLSPERYTIKGSSPYERSYLLINESYLRNWKATLNGRPVPVLRANMRFMAIAIEEGTFQVDLAYQLERFWIGLGLSGLGLLLGVVIIIRSE